MRKPLDGVPNEVVFIQSAAQSNDKGHCPLCMRPLSEAEVFTDEYGVAAHADCHDMDRSANFGDWITREYDFD